MHYPHLTVAFLTTAVSAVLAGKCNVCGTVKLPETLDIDFRQVKSVKDMTTKGLVVTDTYQWRMAQVGPNGESCYGQASNLAWTDDGLDMIFKGSTASDKNMTGAEFYFDAEKKGITSMQAWALMRVPSEAGTSSAMSTYEADTSKEFLDSASFEVLGSQLADKENGGFRLTERDYADAKQKDQTISKWSVSDTDPASLSTEFRWYMLLFMPDKTYFAFNSKWLDGPTKFPLRPKVPQKLIINHGTNGVADMYGAPLPKKDLKMTIQRLVIYYNNSPDGSSSDCEAGTNLCP